MSGHMTNTSTQFWELRKMKTGTKMGMDYHADTTCVNKHAFIESVIEGLTVRSD